MSIPEVMTNEHLSDELLAAFADGRLGADERQLAIRHLALCDDCNAVFQTVAEAQELGEIAAPAPNVVRPRFGAWRAFVPAAIAAAAAVAVVLSPPAQERIDIMRTGGMAKMAKAANSDKERVVASRLSGGFEHRPLVRTYRGPSDGGGEEDYAVQAAAGDVLERADSSTSLKDIRAAAIAHLLLKHRDEAVAKFEQALAATKNPDARLFSDAAAAYVERSRYTGSTADAARAKALADRAWSMQQTPEAAWNRAYARELLEQKDEAIAAWNEYLKLDPSSAWAHEARERVADLQTM